MKSSLKIDEKEYCTAMDSLRFSQAQKEQMAQRLMDAEQERPAHRSRLSRRIIATVTACILVLTLSVTALAAGIPDFRAWLFGPDSGVADDLTPVSAFGNNDGLTMEVLGATGDKNNVCVYFTLQDTAGENRLREDMDVIASVKLNDEYPEREDVIEGGMEKSTEVVKYDPETQTALCKYQMTTGRLWDNSKMAFADEPYDATGAHVRMRVTRLIVTNDEFRDSLLDVSALEATTETSPISAVQHREIFSPAEFQHVIGSAETIPVDEARDDPSLENFRDEAGKAVMLKPGEGVVIEGREYAKITAVGFIGGKLHIQSRSFDTLENNFAKNPVYTTDFFSVSCADAREPLSTQNGGYKQSGGGQFRIQEDGTAVMGMAMNESELAADEYYWEQVFDIGPDELENFDFYGKGANTTFRDVDFTAEPFTLEESVPERVQEYLK